MKIKYLLLLSLVTLGCFPKPAEADYDPLFHQELYNTEIIQEAVLTPAAKLKLEEDIKRAAVQTAISEEKRKFELYCEERAKLIKMGELRFKQNPGCPEDR